MSRDRLDTILVAIVVIGAVLGFLIPMPWGAIPAAIALALAIPMIVMRGRT